MASVVIAGDTSGTVTLAAPAVAGTTTLTLPTANGTLITTGSSGQSIPRAALPAGSVLQVVQTVYNTLYSQSMSSPTMTNITGFNATITPTSASSKILVSWNINASTSNSGLTQHAFATRFTRNGSTVSTFLGQANGSAMQGTSAATSVGWESFGMIACECLDSPATTSALTYQIQLGTQAAGDTIYLNRSGRDAGGNEAGNGRYVCTLTLMEIAA